MDLNERIEDAQLGVHTNITVSLYDANTLRESHEHWDSLTKQEKLAIVKTTSPLAEYTHRNTATNQLLYVLADNLVDSTQRQTATHLALGNDNTQPVKTNTGLNNEVYRSKITEAFRTAGTLETITYIDSNEANGYTLTEIGLMTGPTGDTNAQLLNHSLISDVEKSSSVTATFAVDLIFTVL